MSLAIQSPRCSFNLLFFQLIGKQQLQGEYELKHIIHINWLLPTAFTQSVPFSRSMTSSKLACIPIFNDNAMWTNIWEYVFPSFIFIGYSSPDR